MNIRKSFAHLSLGMVLCLASSSGEILRLQQLAHEVTVINIAVPVRVFDGNKFIDNLAIEDFEVYENGVKQEIEAVYLVRKTAVERGKPPDASRAVTSLARQLEGDVKARHFVLYFIMDEYLPKLSQAIDLFFTDTLAPQDTLRVVTAEDSWQVKAEASEKGSPKVQAEQLKSRLRRSLALGGSRLRSLLSELQRLASDFKGNPEGFNPMQVRDIAEQIINLKVLDEGRVKKLAGLLKGLEGQKHVILFYQKESYLVPTEFSGYFGDLASEQRGDVRPDKIKELFADAGMAVHFLYITKTKMTGNNVEFRESDLVTPVEMTGDFFQAFRNMAAATGGIAETSANPEFALRRAAMAVDNYYLLYYRPSAIKADGTFKTIKVKVKGRGDSVSHRAGYIDK
jgi:VWFA-related protein